MIDTVNRLGYDASINKGYRDMEHFFDFYLGNCLTLGDQADCKLIETRGWIGNRSEAFDAAWKFCETAGYDFFDDAD
jgi:hypothetical protein